MDWVKEEEGIATVGITSLARSELGDIVFVQLPEIGKSLEVGDEACVLESTKAAADFYSPLKGEVVAVNERLKEQPDLINTSSEDKGWLFKVKSV